MTLPCEQFNAVQHTREFLRALLDPKKTPKVPREIRRWASSCLRHYPWGMHMEEARLLAPGVWGEPPTIDLIRYHYYLCYKCAKKYGGKMPKKHVCTVSEGPCPHCKKDKTTLIPWVDFDWPKINTRFLRD